MLCQTCRATLKLGCPVGRYNHHNSPRSFYNAIEAECFICRNIWQKIIGDFDPALYESGDWIPRTYEDFLSQLRPHLPKEEVFRFFPTPHRPEPGSLPFLIIRDRSLPRYYNRPLEFFVTLRTLMQVGFRQVHDDRRDRKVQDPERIPPGNPSSTSQNPHLWKQWLRQCSTSHSKCRTVRDYRRFSPSRLVEIVVEDGKAAGWRIIKQTEDDHRSYCTLSHCWGKSYQFCLEKETFNTLLKGQAITGLPKTYREACEVATSLGFSHIWIDSLCIIQDDVADWGKESAIMGRIYEGAVVNIAATWAADGSLGMYHRRDPTIISAPDLGGGQMTLANQSMYFDDIENAPLNTRGWVLQERYLAPGQLSFTKNQVYWECRELMACEQFPRGMAEGIWNRKLMADFFDNSRNFVPPVGKPTVDFGDTSNVTEAWGAVVKAYSACYLTKGSDKLVALAGLAGKARETLKDIYLAGLWRKELLSQLCWHTCPQNDRTVSRLKGCWIPTWSWASLDGPVSPDTGFRPLPGTVLVDFAEILDVHVATGHPSGCTTSHNTACAYELFSFEAS